MAEHDQLVRSGAVRGNESAADEMIGGGDMATGFSSSGMLPPVLEDTKGRHRLSASDRGFGGGMKYDAGPALISAVDSILGDKTNPHIKALAGSIEATLLKHGIHDIKWVGEMLFQFRGAMENDPPSDLPKYIANVKKGERLGAIGPNGANILLSRVHAATSTEGPCVMPGRFDSVTENPLLTAMMGPKASTGLPSTTRRNPKPPEHDDKEKEKKNPQLELAIKAIGYATKIPGLPEGAKAGLEAIHSTLEIMATEEGEAGQYGKHIADLGSATFKVVGAIVKSGGMNAELAEQAAEQLGKVATYVGYVGKAFSIVDDLVKVFSGKTIGGRKVSNDERMLAAIDIIKVAGGTTVGIGVTISVTEFQWIFNNIGLPSKFAIEEAGLSHLFAGKNPEQMKAEIAALPAEDPHAISTIEHLMYKTFPNTKSMFSQMVLSDAWKDFWQHHGNNKANYIKYCTDRHWRTDLANPETASERHEFADGMKTAAAVFIDKQLADAHSWTR